MKRRILLIIAGVFFFASASHGQINYLEACWDKQVRSLDNKYVLFSYQEVKKRHYHSFEPWQFTTTKSEGRVSIGSNSFAKVDSVRSGNGKYVYSKTQLADDMLLFVNYRDTSLMPVTKRQYHSEQIETGRYSPIMLLDHFYRNRNDAKEVLTDDVAKYTLTIDKTVVTISMRKSDLLVGEIALLNDEELYGLYGDVRTTFTYEDYTSLHAPSRVVISKISGKLTDTVTVSGPAIESAQFRPLGTVANFTWKPEKDNMTKVEVAKFGSNIHFVDLKHCSARALVVEFADYLLVAEAPLTVANGECIIAEARKIAPTKPIRYFVFTHFHNWYLGGIRPFIHAGATILTIPENRSYLEYIASREHTLTPDSLHLDPKPLKIEAIGDGIRIGDGQMMIYHIGKKSEHTYDYLVYYFPQEKMLFQADLVWINKTGPLVKAGPRQAGLYKAIKDLGLDVQTVVQSWPLEDYNVKSIIDFEELERSVLMQ